MGRPDGKRIKNLSVEYLVGAHIMAKRSDAMNAITLNIPVEPIRRYLNAKRKEGKRYGYLTVIVAAIIRVISQYPGLNRFVINKNIYARNEISIGMVVLKGGKIDGVGTMDKMRFTPDMTIEDVDRVITEYVEKNRSEDDVNGTDKVAGILTSIPGLLRVGVSLLKWMDKHSIMPKKIVEISPFHCSLVLTNLASIKTNAIYHHAYDFGTTSMTLAMGQFENQVAVKKGETVVERVMPLGLVMDERIASGAYFAMAFHEYQKYMADPAMLEVPPEKIVTE